MTAFKKKNHNRTNIGTGLTGEYYVAAELSKRGYVASITLKNTHNIDILASCADGSRTVSIQVKTSSGENKKWGVGPRAENISSPNFFYVFVNLNHDKESPEFHIVSSEVVAQRVKKNLKNWSRIKEKNTSRKKSSVRIFTDEDCEYIDLWEDLGLDS